MVNKEKRNSNEEPTEDINLEQQTNIGTTLPFDFRHRYGVWRSGRRLTRTKLEEFAMKNIADALAAKGK